MREVFFARLLLLVTLAFCYKDTDTPLVSVAQGWRDVAEIGRGVCLKAQGFLEGRSGLAGFESGQ